MTIRQAAREQIAHGVLDISEEEYVAKVRAEQSAALQRLTASLAALAAGTYERTPSEVVFCPTDEGLRAKIEFGIKEARRLIADCDSGV